MDQLSEHLPIWVQIFLATGGFLGAGFAAFKGYTQKRRAGTDEPPSRPSGDAVVISAALADSTAIRELTSVIRELRACIDILETRLETIQQINERGVRANEQVADVARKIYDDVVRRFVPSR